MTKPVEYLPQDIRAFTFIQRQLMNLTEDCHNTLQNGQLSRNHFVELDRKLQKILYETRTACSSPPIKPVMSDFDVVKSFSRGGFGIINLVRHKQTQKVLAMKEINILNSEHRQAVLVECAVMYHLDHPLVLSMFCSFEAQNKMYLVTEYVGGGDCFDLYERQHFSEDMSRFYIAELVLAVEYIHSFGIIHRDIKPDNILISNTGHLKLVDFGLSKIGSVKRGACLTEEDCRQVAREFNDGEEKGTIDFIPPEVWVDGGYGKPTDWWAIGALFFFFLTGKYPFIGDSVYEIKDAVINGDIEWPEDGHPVSDEARNLVLLLLKKDPVKRLGTRGASEVKQHSFFQNVDWADLLNQTPPFVPVLENEEDTSYFETMADPSSDVDDCESETSYDQQEATVDISPGEHEDFSYVAFNLNEVYGSPKPLFPSTSEQPGHKDDKPPESYRGSSLPGIGGSCDGTLTVTTHVPTSPSTLTRPRKGGSRHVTMALTTSIPAPPSTPDLPRIGGSCHGTLPVTTKVPSPPSKLVLPRIGESCHGTLAVTTKILASPSKPVLPIIGGSRHGTLVVTTKVPAPPSKLVLPITGGSHHGTLAVTTKVPAPPFTLDLPRRRGSCHGTLPVTTKVPAPLSKPVLPRIGGSRHGTLAVTTKVLAPPSKLVLPIIGGSRHGTLAVTTKVPAPPFTLDLPRRRGSCHGTLAVTTKVPAPLSKPVLPRIGGSCHGTLAMTKVPAPPSKPVLPRIGGSRHGTLVMIKVPARTSIYTGPSQKKKILRWDLGSDNKCSSTSIKTGPSQKKKILPWDLGSDNQSSSTSIKTGPAQNRGISPWDIGSENQHSNTSIKPTLSRRGPCH